MKREERKKPLHRQRRGALSGRQARCELEYFYQKNDYANNADKDQ
ncbi:hypothetical protein [Paenibacillus sp. Marseille-P2973]|nr:hypothetical protein [Paenibacillus sp. Marseille-P2973]